MCLGCVLGACMMTVTWGSGQLIAWRANTKRRKALDAVEREEAAPVRLSELRPIGA